MKTIMMMTFLFITLVSCGKYNSSSDGGDSVNKLGLTDYMNVSYIVPDPMMLGGAKRFEYNGQSYLIGNGSLSSMVTKLNTYSIGTHALQVKGQFAKETGHFPNPMAEFDVIQVNDIK